MNFLNSDSMKKHMSAEHNYLEHLKEQGILVPTALEDSTELETPESETPFSEPSLIVVEKEAIGRGSNANVPDFLRRVIAVTANTSNEKQVDIGRAFGVSQPVVANAKQGRNGNGDANLELRELVSGLKEDKKTNRETIEDAALMKTLSTLNILTESDIECLGAKDKADVAVKLSKVAANMRDKVINNDNRTLLIIKAPPVREHLDSYPSIQVG